MRRLALVSLCLGAVACSTATTQLVKTWRDPAYTGREVKKVLVIGLTPNPQNQQLFEDAMGERLAKVGVATYTGYATLPKGQMASQEKVVEIVRSLGIEIVVVSRLVALRNEVEYVPTATYAPAPGYYGMYGYYSYGYTAVYTPGYVTQTQAAYLETNAYDVQAEKLVWSGITRTFDYSSVDAVTRSAAKRIVTGLLDQGVL
jgi:hypothetical protein